MALHSDPAGKLRPPCARSPGEAVAFPGPPEDHRAGDSKLCEQIPSKPFLGYDFEGACDVSLKPFAAGALDA